MVDFLKAAKQIASETVEIAGTKIEVRGLTYGEISAISKPRPGEKTRDVNDMSRDLIIACCFTQDGKKLIPVNEDFSGWNPTIVKELGEAVARVNGAPSGNLHATDAADSASA